MSLSQLSTIEFLCEKTPPFHLHSLKQLFWKLICRFMNSHTYVRPCPNLLQRSWLFVDYVDTYLRTCVKHNLPRSFWDNLTLKGYVRQPKTRARVVLHRILEKENDQLETITLHKLPTSNRASQALLVAGSCISGQSRHLVKGLIKCLHWGFVAAKITVKG